MLRCSCRRFLAIASLLVSGIAPSAAAAQPALERWTGLKTAGLDTIYVRDVSGIETSGKLLQLNPDSLVLLAGGVERRFELTEVSRIQKRDSLKDGTLIGAIAGVAMGALAAGISDCPGDQPGGSCAALRTTTVALSIGVYAGLGAGVDALVRGRSTVYDAPRPSRAKVSVLPGGRAPLHLSIGW